MSNIDLKPGEHLILAIAFAKLHFEKALHS
jgi:hypothetical protein